MIRSASSRLALVAGMALALCGAAPAVAASADKEPDIAAVTAQTKSVADAYFAAYIARDWDRLEPLLADNADFQDSTASLVFGSVLRSGKPAMMKLFRQGYSSISKMEFRETRTLQFANDSIHEGALDWSVDMGGGRIVSTVMPFLTIIRVEDGKVVHHRDYADYTPFLRSNEASLTKSKGA